MSSYMWSDNPCFQACACLLPVVHCLSLSLAVLHRSTIIIIMFHAFLEFTQSRDYVMRNVRIVLPFQDSPMNMKQKFLFSSVNPVKF